METRKGFPTNKAEARAFCDRQQSLSELVGLPAIIAKAECDCFGFYCYIDAATEETVFVGAAS